MDLVVLIGVAWLFLLLLVLAILRTAALADRTAERRLRESSAEADSEARRHARTAAA